MSDTPPQIDPVRPDLIVLDVNETLSDLAPLGAVFAQVGLDENDVAAWFADVLGDGFALTVLGDNPSFAEVAAAGLRVRLAAAGSPDPAAGARQVLESFTHLEPHADVVPGLRAIAAAGCRIVTLSNASADVARTLLAGTGADDVVEAYLDVAGAAWKPDPRAYGHALSATGVAPGRAMLVAAHPWDLEGARRAGLRTAWINRVGGEYPAYFDRADLEAPSFVDLAAAFGAPRR
ncbi:haloacid dehalogenase type II [Isoptericola aurantiacus]|uniref:haloacid dehalogenase type II n=1 Tax=Isoptericola aurantiacus TaxID=3377839 RepID=UPI00383B4B61